MAGEWQQWWVWGSGWPLDPYVSLSPCLYSEGWAQSLLILGVFFLSAAWAMGWQGESGRGRGLEPRTRSAHRPALGSEPCACLTSTSCFLMCEGPLSPHCMDLLLVPGDPFAEKVMPLGCHGGACATLIPGAVSAYLFGGGRGEVGRVTGARWG